MTIKSTSLMASAQRYVIYNIQAELLDVTDPLYCQDAEVVKDALKAFYKKDLETKEPSVKGWNWGKTDFQGESNLEG